MPTPPAAPTCREVVELLVDEPADDPAPTLSAPVTAHLAACPDCRTYLSQMRLTVRALRALPSEPVVPDAEHALRRLFRRWHQALPD